MSNARSRLEFVGSLTKQRRLDVIGLVEFEKADKASLGSTSYVGVFKWLRDLSSTCYIKTSTVYNLDQRLVPCGTNYW